MMKGSGCTVMPAGLRHTHTHTHRQTTHAHRDFKHGVEQVQQGRIVAVVAVVHAAELDEEEGHAQGCQRLEERVAALEVVVALAQQPHLSKEEAEHVLHTRALSKQPNPGAHACTQESVLLQQLTTPHDTHARMRAVCKTKAAQHKCATVKKESHTLRGPGQAKHLQAASRNGRSALNSRQP